MSADKHDCFFTCACWRKGKDVYWMESGSPFVAHLVRQDGARSTELVETLLDDPDWQPLDQGPPKL